MKVYDFSENVILTELEGRAEGKQYFLVATRAEFAELGKILDIHPQAQKYYENLDENIRFESYPDHDFLSFVYFDLLDGEFEFEVFSLYYGNNFVALVVEQEEGLHNQFMDAFSLENFRSRAPHENRTFVYYKFLSSAFTKMFTALSSHENTLSRIENEILTAEHRKDFDFQQIVALKNDTFATKKYLRLLLYVGDQLMLNDNGLLPQEALAYFRNLDMRINRMYEYASNLHEAGEHLMELYNSTVNSRTNDMINKLTILTVFATPLTVLTGLYGMNFVNIPELQHPYGYFILLGIMVLIVLLTYLALKKMKLL